MAKAKPAASANGQTAANYSHPTATSKLRPDVGVQHAFPKEKRKPPKTYRYDSSLAPALEWDGQNPARDQGEALIRQILDAKNLADAKAAAEKLKTLGKPFLNWAGKAERLSFDVPTLPMFVHERLSTQGIIETLKGHRRDKQKTLFDLFGDPQYSIADREAKAYEYPDKWANRMILGDSLVVMNSLLEYEGMGGQVQMIYMDPPYGVKFGSNFQPFVRKRDVSHNDDDDMTREPEMVQAYRDTWEVGLHSYLTYMRDRLKLAKELLTQSGSIFVQISDENLHHVRELMDEVFDAQNFISLVTFQKTTGQTSELLPGVADYLLWYSRDKSRVKFNQLYSAKAVGGEGTGEYVWLKLSDGEERTMSSEERRDPTLIPAGARVFRHDSMVSQGFRENTTIKYVFKGTEHFPGQTNNWKTTREGLDRLAAADRLVSSGRILKYKRYIDDFPVFPIANTWSDTTTGGSSTDPRAYVVQTVSRVVQRCILMTSNPGDLVLDPTSGSGTTAYVAEQWGRRWIAIDISRVPLALARQRLLTATFPWNELNDDKQGPAGGFVYKRKRNRNGEEIGGIVPHITLKSIATAEPPQEENVVDRPEVLDNVVRVSGPFTFEATIPTPVDWDGDGEEDSGAPVAQIHGEFVDRMLAILQRNPSLRLQGNQSVKLENIRPAGRSLVLNGEAVVDATAHGQKPTLKDAVAEADEKNRKGIAFTKKPVAIVFGPENGAISESLVYQAAKEANGANFTHLYVIGFGIQPEARRYLETCKALPCTYVQATPDVVMGDLLKTMRSSQIFSVCGLPDVDVRQHKPKTAANGDAPKTNGKSKEKTARQYEVELKGLDVFDPVTMAASHLKGDDVPAWFLDTDYDETRCFHVCQAFFPRTAAWDNLKKALKADYKDSVWEHLSGTISAPFEAGEHKRIAVKVIDDRGNELLVVKALDEAGK